MAAHFLSIGEFAQRANLSVNTLNGYRRKGLLPQPDASIGRVDGWSIATVDQWLSTRPGYAHLAEQSLPR